MRLKIRTGLVFAVMLSLATVGRAQIIFSDDFNTDSSSSYRVLEFTPDNDEVTFDFDYSTVGIPEAPNSAGGGTTGVLMRANNPAGGPPGATSAVQIVPIGVGRILPENYRLTADLWMNVNGPLPLGGTGSTQAFMAGVGFNAINNGAIEIGNISGTYFTYTGEGGSSTDLRSFTNDGFNAPGINQSPTNNASDPFFADIFPGGVLVDTLPNQGLVDNQIGDTIAGQMAFTWTEIRIDVVGSQVDFYMNDVLVAQDTDADLSGNVMLGYGDYFSSVADAPQWLFGVWDNFVVTELDGGGIDGDFNDDTVYDCLDVDALVAEIVGGSNDAAFDLTGDTMVNVDDLNAWLAEAGAVNNASGNSYLIGDANLDGSVDISDFNLWNSNKFTNVAAWCSGDFNADGVIDTSDFNLWNTEKFNSADGAAAVPEPAGLVLLMGGCFLALVARRR